MDYTIGQVHEWPLDKIHVDYEFNVRGPVDPLTCQSLAEDIENTGLIHPIVLREYYGEEKEKTGYSVGLVSGFRRYTAHQLFAADTIQGIVRNMTFEEAKIVNYNENVEREDLSVEQEVEGLRYLSDKFSKKELSKVINKKWAWIRPRLLVSRLPEKIRVMVYANMISLSDAVELYYIEDEGEQILRANDLKKDVRDLEELPRVKQGSSYTRRYMSKTKTELKNLLGHLEYEGIPDKMVFTIIRWALKEITSNDLVEDLRNAFPDYEGSVDDFEISETADLRHARDASFGVMTPDYKYKNSKESNL
jgi:ParB/RepB/Spo0J family partition protein